MQSNPATPFFVAIHIGAGYHSKIKETKYKQLLRKTLLGAFIRDGIVTC
jgi:hypothetical protein